MWVDGCNKFEDDNNKTVDVTLHGELVCGYVHWIYVAICTFQARGVLIEDLFI
jgi:hypothetical protein